MEERNEMGRKRWRQGWFWLLAGILALSFFLNFWNIGQNGTGNEYYAACIKSMTQSWHNFFYVSFDPAGMVSVDKPPLGLWVQALFCKVLGYSGWAMLLPQALAGTVSCLMLYLLVARPFGRPAGLLSALCFALFPAVVAVSRNNTIDMQLILLLLVAVWFLMKALRTGKWRWLVLCGLFIGLGFNVKMLQAYLILPAVAATYLLFAKGKVWKRFAAGGLAAAVMLAVSFAWVAAVDLTPAAARPYVDSTSGNSMLELVLGHNGTERLFGQGAAGGMQAPGGAEGGFPQMQGDAPADAAAPGAWGPDGQTDSAQTPGEGDAGAQADSGYAPSQGDADTAAQDGQGEAQTDGLGGPGGQMQNGGMGAGAFDIGNASPTRLWSDSLYGQGSWLLLFAIAALVLSLRWKSLRQKRPEQYTLVFWGLWLAVGGLFFSFAGFFHSYYLCMMAPPVAALCGVGLTQMFRLFHGRREAGAVPQLPAQAGESEGSLPEAAPSRLERLRPWLLLIALAANIAVSAVYVMGYASVRAWLAPVILACGVVGVFLFLLSRRRPRRWLFRLSSVLLVVSLLAGCAVWAWTPSQTPSGNATMPTAGPSQSGTPGGPQGRGAQTPQAQEAGEPPAALDGGDADGAASLPERTGGGGAFGGAGGTGASALEAYLLENYTPGSFLLTANRANDVAQLIIDTGLPCYAYGGFLGTDNSLTVEKLKQLVSQGKVTYFLVSGQGGGSDALTDYVEANAQQVDASAYGGSSGMGGTLYRFS